MADSCSSDPREGAVPAPEQLVARIEALVA
jgi:hypothetical protein